jgi:hypothetical protein
LSSRTEERDLRREFHHQHRRDFSPECLGIRNDTFAFSFIPAPPFRHPEPEGGISAESFIINIREISHPSASGFEMTLLLSLSSLRFLFVIPNRREGSQRCKLKTGEISHPSASGSK